MQPKPWLSEVFRNRDFWKSELCLFFHLIRSELVDVKRPEKENVGAVGDICAYDISPFHPTPPRPLDELREKQGFQPRWLWEEEEWQPRGHRGQRPWVCTRCCHPLTTRPWANHSNLSGPQFPSVTSEEWYLRLLEKLNELAWEDWRKCITL